MVHNWPPLYSSPGKYSLGRGPRYSIAAASGGTGPGGNVAPGNGLFAADTGWTLDAGWSVAAGVLSSTVAAFEVATAAAILAIGSRYFVQFQVTAWTSGTIIGTLGTDGTGVSAGSATTVSGEITATGADFYFRPGGAGGFTGSIDNLIIVRV